MPDFIPDPDTIPDEKHATLEEQRQASELAELLDSTTRGSPPAAMPTQQRELVETAAIISSAHHSTDLPGPRLRTLIDDVLVSALAGTRPEPARSPPLSTPRDEATYSTMTDELARRRHHSPRRRWMMAGLALVGAAAAAATLLQLPSPSSRPPGPSPTATLEVPESWRSRAADPLIGAIQREQAGAASVRIDTLFTDRMSGFRDLQLSVRPRSHRGQR